MHSRVLLYDTVTITPSSVDAIRKQLQDSLTPIASSATRGPLLVDVIATHAGRLTRNHGFYLPTRMREGVSSMLEGYGKPVLKHHLAREDSIGRIAGAQYIDASQTLSYDSVRDSLFRDLCNPEMPFIQSVNLIADELVKSEILRDPQFPGLGYVKATLEITDADAIVKILDGRYLTVSTGASTDRAVCSVCKTDWAVDGEPCIHRPGKEYDGKLCFLIAGKLIYDECSFVNIPADTLAGVITIYNGNEKNAVIVEQTDAVCNVSASFVFKDSDIPGGNNMELVKEAWEKVETLLKQEDVEKTDKTKALEDFLKEFKDSEFTTQAQVELDKLTEDTPADVVDDSKETPLHKAARNGDTEIVALLVDKGADIEAKNRWGETPLHLAVSSGQKEVVEVLIEKGADVNAKDQVLRDAISDPVADDKTDDITDTDDEELSEEDQHYEDMFAFGLEVGLLAEDAKLTTAGRKKLAKSVFCKPPRGYPCHDCGHVRSAMAYAKKHDEASSVLVCIRRKAKALGCLFKADSKKDEAVDIDTWEAEIDQMVKDHEEGKTNKLQDTNDAATEVKCESCDKVKDQLVLLKAQLTALREELSDVYNEHSESMEANIGQLADAKVVLVDLVAKFELLSGEDAGGADERAKTMTSMSLEDIVKKATELKDAFNMEAAVEKLNDGMTREPDETVTDPTLQDSTLQEGDTDKNADGFDGYRKVFNKIKDAKGIDDAILYLENLKQANLVPVDFDPE